MEANFKGLQKDLRFFLEDIDKIVEDDLHDPFDDEPKRFNDITNINDLDEDSQAKILEKLLGIYGTLCTFTNLIESNNE